MIGFYLHSFDLLVSQLYSFCFFIFVLFPKNWDDRSSEFFWTKFNLSQTQELVLRLKCLWISLRPNTWLMVFCEYAFRSDSDSVFNLWSWEHTVHIQILKSYWISATLVVVWRAVWGTVTMSDSSPDPSAVWLSVCCLSSVRVGFLSWLLCVCCYSSALHVLAKTLVLIDTLCCRK